MGRLATPHTQSQMIAAVAKSGEWRGRRKGIHIALRVDPQTTIDGRRIHWTAYVLGDWRHRRRGLAGTVVEALDQIERALRRVIP
jgi:hypothetical protein